MCPWVFSLKESWKLIIRYVRILQKLFNYGYNAWKNTVLARSLT